VLTALGQTQGLWSPLRGMARQQEAYYARLNNADLPKRNDSRRPRPAIAGRARRIRQLAAGSVPGSGQFHARPVVTRCLQGAATRAPTFARCAPWSIGSESSVVKVEALEALHYTAISGSIERARFMAMTGLAPRVARRVLSSLLHFGVLKAATSRAPGSVCGASQEPTLLVPAALAGS